VAQANTPPASTSGVVPGTSPSTSAATATITCWVTSSGNSPINGASDAWSALASASSSRTTQRPVVVGMSSDGVASRTTATRRAGSRTKLTSTRGIPWVSTRSNTASV
jgi:hypothetical protein